MTKEEQYKSIYLYFLATVNAYYIDPGDHFKLNLEKLRVKAKELGLSAGADRDGEDIILFVEKAGEYTIVSTRLNIYTYLDEEMEAQ